MKRILWLILFFAGPAFAANQTKQIPYEVWGSTQITIVNASSASWKSGLVGQYDAWFQNDSAADIYVTTFSVVSATATSGFLLNTRNNPGNIWHIPATDNRTWYFWANGANADVRILYSK